MIAKRLALAMLAIMAMSLPASAVAPSANLTVTVHPSPSPSPTSTPSGTIIWQAGNSAHDAYENGTDYQCGSPVVSGSSFTFNLVRNGTSCGRNQAQPLNSSGTLVQLNEGQQYTFTFTYIDGTPSGAAPGMGYDNDARALIFQTHPYGGGNPEISIGFNNGGVIGNPQLLTLSCVDCAGANPNTYTVWTKPYTPQEVDNFKLVMLVSDTSAGSMHLYDNGVDEGTFHGANYGSGGTGGPWFNFGPYKSQWEGSTSSSLSVVNATINGMTVTTP
jgi:hypothetical protein